MREVLPIAENWAREGTPFAMATVCGTAGSAPRELGASLIVDAAGRVFGTVSGGCVETEVAEAGAEVLAGGHAHVLSFGIPDDPVFDIGLTCGGRIDVLVRAVRPGSPAASDLVLLAERERMGLPATALLVLDGAPGTGAGAVVADGAAPAVPGAADAAGLTAPTVLGYDRAGCRVDADPVTRVLAVPVGAPPRLIVVGAVTFAAALARLGAAMGLAVTVVDARSAFATPERIPEATVVHAAPERYLAATPIDARTAVCVLSHDPRFDVPALRVALASPAGYVGAMGSRTTHDDRMMRLRDAGLGETALRRLRSPIGLHLGGRSPEETALSILAEIVAVRHGASGVPLSQASGPLHTPQPSTVGVT
ncbi:XdhC family protein [Microbacterium sp.]|uniref:XdhC family protein n=1 Tax=Microbacterium sp. TaxID=51671 RepID=UPI003A8639AB